MKYFFKKGFGFYALKPVCIVVELLIISEMRKLRLLSEFRLFKVYLVYNQICCICLCSIKARIGHFKGFHLNSDLLLKVSPMKKNCSYFHFYRNIALLSSLMLRILFLSSVHLNFRE